MDLTLADFKILFDANPRPMFVADRESLRLLVANRAAGQLYGWTPDELCELTLRDIRPLEEMTNFERAYGDQSKESTQTYARLGRHRTKGGRVMDVSMEITPLVFGGRAASLAVITDVTGIDQAERRFRLMVEHSVDGIVLTNDGGVIEYVSPGGKAILGYTPSEVVGTQGRTRVHPDDVVGRVGPLPGETQQNLIRISHRDGTWRWIESSTTNLVHDPAVRAYVSNYRDVTERKLVGEALARSEANFRTLIERTPMATFVHRQGRLIYVNPSFVALLGYANAGELVGRTILEFMHPDDRAWVTARIEQTTKTGTTPRGIGRIVRADGTAFFFEAEGVMLDFDGAPSNVVMGNDVTERQDMFARMALADRMISLGTLAAGVAHEINNPMAYVGANLEILSAELPKLVAHERSRLSDGELAGLVDDALEGAARVRTIVRDLRALARHDDNAAPQPVDVAIVLASSLKMAANELRHRARVVESYAPGVPAVRADGTKLGQVFLNLLLNAAQAIEAGHADRNEVRVRVTRTDDGGASIEVEDTGEGMPEHVKRRIFDPFFTTKAPGSGVGLGLAISHQIVQSLGGTIAVTSELGRGTTFRVTLPGAAPVARAPSVIEEVAPVASARVLLVDDEAAVGRSLRILLAPENDVIAVTSAEEALARLAGGEQYDAILCDLMMPAVSGIELYARLAEVAPGYRDRIIFMTGGAFTAHARDFLDKVNRPHLEKPFTIAQLRDALDTTRTS